MRDAMIAAAAACLLTVAFCAVVGPWVDSALAGFARGL